MRAGRLVSILLLLQARGRMTAHQLAAELDVSVRTIYRDVEALGAAGVPLYGEAGHEGGYRLLEGYRTRLTGLTTGEAGALFLTGLPGAAEDLGLGSVLATAQLKLMAALPEELRDRASRLRERFHLDTSDWYAEPEPTPHLAAVVDASWRERRVRVRYRRWAEPREVDRTLDPYGVVLKGGHWYLVAGAGGSVRTYRVSQILRAEVLEEGFARPADFALEKHWAAYLAEFDGRRFVGEAVVRVSPRMFRLLPDVLEPVMARAASASATPESGGWVRVTMPIESLDQAAGVLLRLGDGAEVLAPEELRERMGEVAAGLGEIYGRVLVSG